MPAFAHGRNAKLRLTDANSASFDFTNGNSVTFTWTRDNPETTVFGNDSHQRIAGLRDLMITGAYVYDGAETSGIPQVLDSLLTASILTLMQYAPGGSVSGCPTYSACMVLSSHSHTAGVNAAVAGNFQLELASGSVTTGSAA